jgi:tripartite-type tricarboxylate transporter receptor subunit TctC
VEGLEHISMICDGYFVFSVNAMTPAANLAEFIALAKRSPGKLNYGTPGAGGNIHVAGELFKLRTGIDIVPIHYKSAANLTADLLSNQIQMSIQGLAIIGPHIKTGKVRPLFIASKERDRQFSEIPTSVELGIPDVDGVTNWFGLHAPKETPAAIVRTLNTIVVEAVKLPAVRDPLVQGGFVPVGNSPEAFRARINKDYRIFGETVRAANVRSE